MTEKTTAPATRTAAAAGSGAGAPTAVQPGAAAAVPPAAAPPKAAAAAQPGGPANARPGAAAGQGRPTGRREAQDQVTVRLPAEGAYLSVLRTATAGLAARLDFTLDVIEDLRIAVDEACAMLLSQSLPGASLECAFTLEAGLMTISVSVPCLAPEPPASDTFAWTVLSALAGNVEAHVGPGDLLTIVMRKSRESSGSV